MSVRTPAVVLHYRERADGFFRAARDLMVLDPPAYAPAIGLLSVHASIALADALLVAVEGDRTKGEDHAEASRRLRAWCSAKQVPGEGIKYLEWLVGRKTRFSYGDRFVDEGELLTAKVKLEQFFVWASQSFPDVAKLVEADRA